MTHAVMAVLRASAIQSRNANVLNLLGTLRPVETVKVELTGPMTSSTIPGDGRLATASLRKLLTKSSST
jgi:hypothetical protein